MVAVAVVGAGLATAAGSAVAGSEEAGAVTNAATTAAQEQQWALQQQEQQEAPYTALGSDALTQLRSLLGLPGGPGSTGGSSSTANTLAALEANPGYQFSKEQGITSTKNAASASGLLLSGNTLKGLTDYTTGLADSEYQQDVGDVMGAVGIGQAAASGTAANIGRTADNLGNIAIGQGQSIANIDANTLAGIERGIGGATSPYSLGNFASPSSLGSGPLSGGTDTAGGFSPWSVQTLDPASIGAVPVG